MKLLEALVNRPRATISAGDKEYRNLSHDYIEVRNMKNAFPKWRKITRLDIAELNTEITNKDDII